MEVDRKYWAETLSRAEKRALKHAFDVSSMMPDFPETISISYACGPRAGVSEPTLEKLRDKGLMVLVFGRGDRYHFTEEGRAVHAALFPEDAVKVAEREEELRRYAEERFGTQGPRMG